MTSTPATRHTNHLLMKPFWTGAVGVDADGTPLQRVRYIGVPGRRPHGFQNAGLSLHQGISHGRDHRPVRFLCDREPRPRVGRPDGKPHLEYKPHGDEHPDFSPAHRNVAVRLVHHQRFGSITIVPSGLACPPTCVTTPGGAAVPSFWKPPSAAIANR